MIITWDITFFRIGVVFDAVKKVVETIHEHMNADEKDAVNPGVIAEREGKKSS